MKGREMMRFVFEAVALYGELDVDRYLACTLGPDDINSKKQKVKQEETENVASSTDKLLTLPTGVKASIVAVVMIFVAAGWYLGFYVDLVDGIKSQKVNVSRLTKTLEEQRLQERN